MYWCTVKDFRILGTVGVCVEEVKRAISYFGHCRCFSVEKVKHAKSRLSKRRAIGPDEISMEFWRSTEKANMERLTRLFNVVFKMVKMPNE